MNKLQNSYHDYTKYNFKPEPSTQGVKYYYLRNQLHKHELGKENNDDAPSKRYAETFDEHVEDLPKDDFVTLTGKNKFDELFLRNEEKFSKGKLKFL